jgi:hypothetical protein
MRIGIRASVLIIGFYCQSIDATDGFTVVQNSSVSVGTREVKYIMLGDGDAIAAIRDGHPRVAGLHHTCISIGPGHPIKSWGGIRSLALALKTIMMKCGDTVHSMEGDALGVFNLNIMDNNNGERGADQR